MNRDPQAAYFLWTILRCVTRLPNFWEFVNSVACVRRVQVEIGIAVPAGRISCAQTLQDCQRPTYGYRADFLGTDGLSGLYGTRYLWPMATLHTRCGVVRDHVSHRGPSTSGPPVVAGTEWNTSNIRCLALGCQTLISKSLVSRRVAAPTAPWFRGSEHDHEERLRHGQFEKCLKNFVAWSVA